MVNDELTRGGDGTHWETCWKAHWDCRIHRLEKALADIAYNTSTSVPLGEWAEVFYGQQLRRCIGTAANTIGT